MQCDGVSANHPAEFDIDESECPIAPFGFDDISGWGGEVTSWTKGRSEKAFLAWFNIDSPSYTGSWPDTWAAIDFLIFTDLNPGGRQVFTSPGCTDINSGSVLKFTDPYTGNRLSAETGSITVCAG